MRYFSILLIILATAKAHAAGFEILVVQNEVTEFSQRFLSGFSSRSDEKISILKAKEYSGKALSRDIKKKAPDLVLTLGDIPIYSAIAELPAIPFIVADLYSLDLENRSNVILTEDKLPIFEEISLLRLLFPDVKTIGTMYNPDYSEKMFQELEAASKRFGIKVTPLKVSTENDVGAYISAFKGKIEAFYVISDFTTTHEKSVRALFDFTRENRIPVLSTQYDHIDQGAALTISADPISLGELAWNRAYETVQNGKISNRKIYLSASELNLSISMQDMKRFEVDPKAVHQLLEQATEKGFTVTVRK